ncbi:SGNH/GDSL hydrolase family protein [Candidatus Omnitrophota bacterium]
MVKRSIFVLIAFLIVVSMLEGVARSITHTRLVQRAPSYHSTMINDPVLHHIWRPSLKKIDKSRSIFYTLITNSQSWVEEHDVALEKPSNTFRIFYVGDSTTQGVVDPQYKMVEIVERELNERYANQDIRFEVINTGTSSYSFIPYYLLIKTKLLLYAPDLIFINIDMTDVANDAAYRRLMVTGDDGDILAIPAEVSQRYILTPQGHAKIDIAFTLPALLVRNSDFFYLVDLAIRKIALRRNPPVVQKQANWLELQWTPTIEKNVNASMKVLASIVKLARTHHVDVCVTAVPHFPQYIGMWSSLPHEVLGQISEKAGIRYLNSFLALREKIVGSELSRYYWASDGTHFNRDGNKIWAEAHLEFLFNPDNHLLPYSRYSKAEVIQQLGQSALFWKEISNRQTKKRAVAYFLDQYRQRGVQIKKSPERYVALLDSTLSEKPQLLQAPIAKLLKDLAVLENDISTR